MTNPTEPLHTKGLVLHSEARYYDLLAWVLTLGRERAFRERLVELVGVRTGESILDVGCGTGTLAITAKRRVGSSGAVVGIDASPEMIARAKQKALTAGVDVRFETAIVETLPFPDASFDVVFNTLMLHHLPRPVREQCAREMRRVIKPEGRIVAVDFATPTGERKGLLARLHRHGHTTPNDIVQLLSAAGLHVKEVGAVGVVDLQFVIASSSNHDRADAAAPSVPTKRSLDPLPTPRWVWGALVAAVLLAHAFIFRGVSSRLALSVAAMTGLIALTVVAHSGIIGAIHSLLRRAKH